MIVLAEVPTRRRVPVQAAGLGAAVLLGLAATVAGTLVPVVGAPVFAVVVGVLLSPLARRRSEALAPGLSLAKGLVLQLSVVFLGAALSLDEVLSVGAGSLPVMLGTLGVCLLLAWLVGRWLGVPRDLRTLIGVGTGICGASAIAAATPAIRAKSNDVAYAISTIFLFNVAAVLVFPPLGHALGLSAHAFGLFAGTAVNDTSSVVAAAGAYGQDAAGYAVVVKLARALMIIPVVLVLTTLSRHAERPETSKARLAASLVPWFLVAFLAVAALNTGGLIPAAAQTALHQAALLFIAIALAAVGLSTDVAALRRAGARPLLLGLILWAAVSSTSLGLQYLLAR
ncbi:putative sulfate exporter family transporter [Micromonospora sp. DR5-3]|uniref:YeiH family protein n=1 Tax=unclassified Micromonospora TaxID=2617518 RepID=UPI0011DAB067|nr:MULTISPECIES: putative sulfate exporter family transporter [unclassified Micromonospora]MCW3819815.1 putative sulfate exporter family transporter [Micromonospora sp. DR5-3]TYC20209.1 putative sulfate exporter family transporter [Micromonospora sp. MP36]